ncbi:MAG: hypothetical protein J5778_01245 [Clostridiales bacterium]|nr:hypothetical protein [Clostridiales bacterium]
MKDMARILTILMAFCLLCTSCRINTDESRMSGIQDSYSISKSTDRETELTSVPATDNTSEDDTDVIEWHLDDIQMLNDISKVSIYRVSGDLGNPAITDGIPEGYTYWHGNVTDLYTRGFYADMTISRDIYAYTANSQRFIDISSLPEEITGYAKGYDLLDYVESEEYLQGEYLEHLLQDVDIPTDDIQYPVQHFSIRQEVDGIPTMPLRGGFGKFGGDKKFTYRDIEDGGSWTISQSPVDLFDGKYAAEYRIIPGLKIEETVEKDLDVIPFEKVKEELKERMKSSFVTYSLYSDEENLVKDCTATAAEICYIMIYDNYAEYEKSTKCYLYPFWVVYYKCGIESGLTQQGAAFFPAVEGVKYV